MLDRFSGRPTFIHGDALPTAGERAALSDDHRRRLAALDRVGAAAAERSFGEDSRIDLNLYAIPVEVLVLMEQCEESWIPLIQALYALRNYLPLLPLAAFGFPEQEDDPLSGHNPYLQHIGGGVEAWAFQDAEGSIHKFFRPREDWQVGASWSRQDPEAALAWVQGLPDTDQAARDQALPDIVDFIATRDPATAAAFVQNSPNPAIFQQDIASIAQNFASVDPQAALVWTNSLPDGDVKNKALSSVLVSLSDSDFTAAWNDAANLTVPGTATTILGNLVGNLAKKNPAEAAAQLGQLPTETAQLSATTSVASTWVVQDSAGFAAWVNTLPSGSQHDAAVAAAMKALQNAKLPAPERASLTEALNQALQPNPTR